MAEVGTRLKIGGLKELRRDLRAVDKSLPRRVLPAAARRAADVVLPVARELAQEFVAGKGRVPASHRVVASQRRAAVRAGGAKLWWIRALHGGTVPRFNKKTTPRRYTGQLPPNRWLERSLVMVGPDRVRKVYDRELTALLSRYGF